MKCPGRYTQFFDALKLPCMVLGNTLYYQSSGVIRAWGPVSDSYPLTRQQGLFLCRQLRGRLVITTDGFTDDPRQGWYAVICDKFRPLEEMKAKSRSEINRGLRNCQIQQVDADYIARNGYQVYSEAVKGYSSYYDTFETETEFRQRHQSCQPLGDLVHYWAALHEGQLVGYSQNVLFDQTEVNYWTVKLHPAYLSLYPSYALFHKMNEFYLETHHFHHVNDGWRSLLHETQIQDFLIRKFGFRKAYTPMSIVYTPATSLLVRLCYPWRHLARKVDLRLAGLCTLEAIRRGEEKTETADPDELAAIAKEPARNMPVREPGNPAGSAPENLSSQPGPPDRNSPASHGQSE